MERRYTSRTQMATPESIWLELTYSYRCARKNGGISDLVDKVQWSARLKLGKDIERGTTRADLERRLVIILV
jgi:hypothetical protein